MRAKVAKKDMLQAILRACSIADRKSVVPILSHVMLDFKEGLLCLKSTDLDHSMIENISAEVETFGTVAVPASTLCDIARKVPDGVSMDFCLSDKGHKLTVSSGKSKFELSTLNASDFPSVAAIKPSVTISMKTTDINKLITRTKFSMSNEESRHNLNGIYLHKENGKLKAVSTDGHRLSLTEVVVDTNDQINGVIISRKTVLEVKKLADIYENVDLELSMNANQIQFSLDNVTLISKLVDGKFPEYNRVLPEKNVDFFRVKRSDFIEIVDRVSVISDDKVKAIKLILNDESVLSACVANSKLGSGIDEVDVIYSGKEWSAGFNASYLLDVAQTLNGEYLNVYVKESLSPIMILDDTEPESMFIVMPMRV